MQVHALRKPLYRGAHARFQLLRLLVVQHDGVEVQRQRDARFGEHLAFQPVERLVRGERGQAGVHFGVRRRERDPLPVAVNFQIVYAENALSREQDLTHAPDERFVGRLTQQFGTRLFQYARALPENEQRNRNADVAVRLPRRVRRKHHAEHDGERGDAVARAVRCRRPQRIRIQPPRADAVKEEHSRLDEHGAAQNDVQPPDALADRARCDGFDRFAQQFHGEREHQKGDDHGRDVFDPSVSVRVFAVGGFFRHAEGDEGDRARTAVA